MKNRMISVLVIILTLSLAFAPSGLAQESIWEMANSDHYGKKVGGMLGRGLLNLATCFVDVIVHTVEGTQEGPPFVGTMTGLGSGIGCTALRATSGALDIITFWVPGFNGFAVSRSYSNCLEFEGKTTRSYETPPATPSYQQPPASQAPTPAATTYVAPQPEEAPAKKSHDVMEYVKK